MVAPTPSRSNFPAQAALSATRPMVVSAQVLGYQLGNSLSQCHCFLFETLTDATLATVDSRTNADFGVFHDIVVLFTHILYIR